MLVDNSVQIEVQKDFEDYIERMMAQNERMKEDIEQAKKEVNQAKTNLLNSAKAMKTVGLSFEVIQQATGLTTTEIENL